MVSYQTIVLTFKMTNHTKKKKHGKTYVSILVNARHTFTIMNHIIMVFSWLEAYSSYGTYAFCSSRVNKYSDK